MIRSIILGLLLLLPHPQVDRFCEDEALRRWNDFARVSNDYVNGWRAGVRNVKLRAKMDRDFASVMRCDCF